MTVEYDIKENRVNCFYRKNKNLRQINLKKTAKEFSDKFQNLSEK